MSIYRPSTIGNSYVDRAGEAYIYPVTWISARFGPWVIGRWFVGLRPWRRVKTGRWPVVVQKFA